MSEPAPTPFRLELSRHYAFPREKVFQAFIRPEAVESWLGPSPEWRMIVHRMEIKEGGDYRFEFLGPEGQHDVLVGQYREILPPERIVFTWRWEDNPIERETTLVTIDFRQAREGTDLLLKHTSLSVADSIELHRFGWTGAFDRLPGYLGG